MRKRVKILIGDVREKLSEIDADSVDCIVTSPPYWGLRDYGIEGQLGLEPTLAEHIETMMAVCTELHRVLKPAGSLWLNYGDCYATTPNGRSAKDTKAAGNDDRTFRDKPFSTIQGTLKPKDLCMVPNRVAIALQDAGWWVRSEIIWAKPNPMPESVTDRPAGSHEKIFLLTKSARYDYDADGVRIGLKPSSVARLAQDIEAQAGSARANGGKKTNGNMKVVGGERRGAKRPHQGFNSTWDKMSKADQQENGRNLRNWEPEPEINEALEPENKRAELRAWRIATRPFSDAHFATFPPELARRCIAAGCPPGGLVLDPFGGAGTTGLVAAQMQRRAILIELNPEYAEMARQRIEGDAPLFSEMAGSADTIDTDQGDMFTEVAG